MPRRPKVVAVPVQEGPSRASKPTTGDAIIEAPDQQYLEALRTQMEVLYAEQDVQIQRMRDVRDGKKRVAISDEFRIVDTEMRDTTIADECQRVAAMLSIRAPSLSITPVRESDAGQRNATLREHWTEACLHYAGGRRPGLNTFESVTDAVVGDGGGWSKLVFARDIWSERFKLSLDEYQDDENIAKGDGKTRQAKYNEATEDAKKEAGPPFAWRDVDAKSVYPVFTGDRISEVIEVSERPEITTFRQYRLKRDKGGNIVFPEELGDQQPIHTTMSLGVVEFVEHWDDTWVSYLITGRNATGEHTSKIVAQWEHGYGRHPYFWAPGLMRSYWSNHKVGWGVSESKRWLVEYRSFLWTLVANVAARDAMPPIQRKKVAVNIQATGVSGEPRAAERWDPRVIYNLDPGEELIPLQFPPIAQSIMELIKIVDESIAKLEAPRVNSEIGGGMEGAGFAINQILAEARVRFNPLANSIERMLEELTRFLWHLVRTKIKEDVWVFSDHEGGGFIKAGPMDLTNGVVVTWKIDPEMPSAKLIEGRYWDEQVKAGFASKDQAIKEQGRNPDEVREGIAMDRMRTTPWYQSAQDRLVLEQLGIGDQGQKVGAPLPIAGQGQPGGIPAPMGGAPGSSPDMGALSVAPGGMPGPMQPPMGGPPGAIPGSSPGVVVPNGSAAPGALALVGR